MPPLANGSRWRTACRHGGMLLQPSRLVHDVLGCAIAVHKELGPGLLESAYDPCLVLELRERGLSFERQVPVPLTYRSARVECSYRVDFVIEGRLVVELKSIEGFVPLHTAQLITYLKLLNLQQGLLINFNVGRLVDGVKNVLLTQGQGRHARIESVTMPEVNLPDLGP